MTVHGKRRKRRPGVHKTARSPETLRWNREHLIPVQPVWMDAGTYQRLAALRTSLQTDGETPAA